MRFPLLYIAVYVACIPRMIQRTPGSSAFDRLHVLQSDLGIDICGGYRSRTYLCWYSERAVCDRFY